MAPLLRKSFCFNFILLLTVTLSNAQNLMTRRYPITSSGPVNRGDFNEDGIPDVVFQTSAGIIIAPVTPQGTLGTLKSFSTNFAAGGDLAVGHFTSSGHLDLAVSHGAVDIFLGRGDGTFQAAPTLLTDGVVFLTSSDFNGDGRNDIATIDQNAIVSLFPGNGDGTFGIPTSISSGLLCCSQQYKIRAGDFDADGRPDLAVKDEGKLKILFNNGNLTFTSKDVYEVPDTLTFLTDFNAQDINQDGFTDLLLTISADGPPAGPTQVGYSVYTSTGKARSFKRTYNRDTEFGIFAGFFLDLTAVDVDGDGINDIVGVSSPAKGIFVFKGLPNGSYSNTPMIFIIGNPNIAHRMIPVDLNRDGRPDFVTLDPVNDIVATSLNALPRAACSNQIQSPSVTACQPTDNVYLRSPMRILANTTDTAAPVTSVQVYVDHKLVKSVHAKSLDTSIPLSLGSRSITVKAWDATGRNFSTFRQANIFSGTPGQVCSTAANTITLCVPPQSTSVSSPVRILAAAQDDLSITAMQVYIDHQLVFNDHSGNYVDHNFTLGAGTHMITVKSWDTSGRTFSQSRTISVQ